MLAGSASGSRNLYDSGIARFVFGTLLAMLILISNLLIVAVQNIHGGVRDWQNFSAAGATVGTPDLLDVHRHIAWEISHHFLPQAFVYPPAVAWFYVPAAHFSVGVGLLLNVVASIFLAVAAALLAANTYRISRVVAIAIILCWAPFINAALLGQQTALALLLSLIAIFGFSRHRPIIAGLAVGLLLYKPQDALAFVLLLAVRKEWRSLIVVAGCAIVWYFGSVAATAGDWNWPTHYFEVIRGYYHADFVQSAPRSVSVPGVLMYLGIPAIPALLCGLGLLIAGCIRFVRVSALEAASMAGLIGVAASPHAWPYDTVLMIPSFLFLATIKLSSRFRYLLAGAYLLAPFWIMAPLWKFNVLAIIAVGGALIWLLGRVNDKGLDDGLIRAVELKIRDEKEI